MFIATNKPARRSWLLALLLDLPPKLLVIFAILFPLSLSIRGGLFGALGANWSLAFYLAGSFVIHMWTRPGWREALGGLVCGGILGLGYAQIFAGADLSIPVTCGSFIGLGSLAVLTIRLFQTTGEMLREKLLTLAACSVLPFAWIVTAIAAGVTARFLPSTYDVYLYAFDSGLGFQPSFSVGRLFSRYAALQQVCRLVYAALPLEVSVLYGWHRMNRRRLSANILLLCIGSNVAGYLLYYCFPAAGPVYAFGKLFPWRPPELSSLLIQTVQIPVAPRNAMPSVHVAAALLVFWNSIAWPKWARAVTGLFLLLTILATLGFGEHYLVDAVVAMPFSLALQAAATTALPWKSPARKNALIGGALAVGIWLVLLRTGAPVFRMSAAIAWSAVAGTVILCLVLRRRLLRSANLSQCDAFAASCKL